MPQPVSDGAAFAKQAIREAKPGCRHRQISRLLIREDPTMLTAETTLPPTDFRRLRLLDEGPLGNHVPLV